MILRPPRSTPLYSSAASDVYKRQSLYSVPENAWDEQACKLLGIDTSMLPEVRPSGAIIGPVSCPDLPRLTGVPVIVGGADNAASAYGCGVEAPGDTMISLGSSGTVVAVSGNSTPDQR